MSLLLPLLVALSLDVLVGLVRQWVGRKEKLSAESGADDAMGSVKITPFHS
jgi:hypothetical protein